MPVSQVAATEVMAPGPLTIEATRTPGVKVVTLVTEPPAPAETSTFNMPTPTAVPFQLPKTLDELGIPKTTYTDQITGMAVDYPTGWLITEPNDQDKQNAMVYSITFRSKQPPTTPKNQDLMDPDITAIDVTVFNQGPKSLDQAINERRAQATQSETGQSILIQSDEDWTLRGGLKAHRFLYNLGNNGAGTRDQLISELVTMVNGKMVLVSGRGDMSLFNIFAASLRETE